jgi:hypothetical protein
MSLPEAVMVNIPDKYVEVPAICGLPYCGTRQNEQHCQQQCTNPWCDLHSTPPPVGPHSKALADTTGNQLEVTKAFK